MIGIYRITNEYGSIYVGSSVNIERRFSQYRRMTEKSQVKLFNSFCKYGVENHIFEILEECEKDVLRKKERMWGIKLKVLDRGCGLNCMVPGVGEKTYTMSDETKKKIGRKHKGKKISEENRLAFISRIQGKKQTPEHIEKRKMIGKDNPMFGKKGKLHPLYGRKLTKEHVKQMSETRKGKGLLGKNGNAKKVVNKKTGELFTSAKEVSILEGINYSTFKAILQGRLENKRGYEYV